ncbi:MAG: adenine phosphoribosyltransferase, partial [Prosthecobacter sp.]
NQSISSLHRRGSPTDCRVMLSESLDQLRSAVRDVPDFPKPGILFKDITPVLADARLMNLAIDGMLEFFADQKVDKVVGIDARGFIFGALMAQRLGAGFVPVRKKGKLPWKTRGVDYSLEYGTNSVEMHVDALAPGERVVLADDLLATGGTADAALQLIRESGATLLGSVFFIELAFLEGRQKLTHGGSIHSLLTF